MAIKYWAYDNNDGIGKWVEFDPTTVPVQQPETSFFSKVKKAAKIAAEIAIGVVATLSVSLIVLCLWKMIWLILR